MLKTTAICLAMLMIAVCVVACTNALTEEIGSDLTPNEPVPSSTQNTENIGARPTDVSEIQLELPEAGKLFTIDGWDYYIEERPRPEEPPYNYPSEYLAILYKKKDDEKIVLDDKAEYPNFTLAYFESYASGDYGYYYKGIVEYNNTLRDDSEIVEYGYAVYSDVSQNIIPIDVGANIINAGDRIIYRGAASDDITDIKSFSLISIKTDGSDRKTFKPKYGYNTNLCIDNGKVYYEGWSGNDYVFPRNVYSLNLDLTGDKIAATVDGAFICTYQDYIYYLGSDGHNIYRVNVAAPKKIETYETCDYSKENYKYLASVKLSETEYSVGIWNDGTEKFFFNLKLPGYQDSGNEKKSGLQALPDIKDITFMMEGEKEVVTCTKATVGDVLAIYYDPSCVTKIDGPTDEAIGTFHIKPHPELPKKMLAPSLKIILLDKPLEDWKNSMREKKPNEPFNKEKFGEYEYIAFSDSYSGMNDISFAIDYHGKTLILNYRYEYNNNILSEIVEGTESRVYNMLETIVLN